ncbi:hypothetical protein SELMODRAFT_418325 [Selaginella moellendorffii]|uniref:Uncharacterized protein n=1 Tax=Selaginella moellendorffii TaxID=88036 RepID=D8S5C8_SELML|nr:hypothetical protein SELMODRAFT_418325 [Selaginella moellendorffii]
MDGLAAASDKDVAFRGARLAHRVPGEGARVKNQSFAPCRIQDDDLIPPLIILAAGMHDLASLDATAVMIILCWKQNGSLISRSRSRALLDSTKVVQDEALIREQQRILVALQGLRENGGGELPVAVGKAEEAIQGEMVDKDLEQQQRRQALPQRRIECYQATLFLRRGRCAGVWGHPDKNQTDSLEQALLCDFVVESWLNFATSTPAAKSGCSLSAQNGGLSACSHRRKADARTLRWLFQKARITLATGEETTATNVKLAKKASLENFSRCVLHERVKRSCESEKGWLSPILSRTFTMLSDGF